MADPGQWSGRPLVFRIPERAAFPDVDHRWRPAGRRRAQAQLRGARPSMGIATAGCMEI